MTGSAIFENKAVCDEIRCCFGLFVYKMWSVVGRSWTRMRGMEAVSSWNRTGRIESEYVALRLPSEICQTV